MNLFSRRTVYWILVNVLACNMVAPSASADDAVRRILDKAVSLDQGQKTRCSLREAMDYFRKRWDIKIAIDAQAFKLEGVKDIDKKEVHIPRFSSLRLGLLLELLVKQADGVCEVRENEVVIVPRQKAKKIPPKQASADWEKASKRTRERLDLLITLKGMNGNTPTADALEHLSGLYTVEIVIDFAAFRKGKEMIEIEDAPMSWSPQNGVQLGEVLKKILEQIHATYQVIDGAIIVAPPRKKDIT